MLRNAHFSVSQLLESSKSRKNFITALGAKFDGTTIGHTLAESGDTKAFQSYLDSITDTIKSYPDLAADAYALLAIKNKMGFDIGFCSASYSKANSLCYLNFLHDLLNNNEDVKKIYALLKTQTNNQWTQGHQIARVRDTECNLKYLSLLDRLLNNGIAADDMLVLLNTNNKDGWKFQHAIGFYKTEKVLQTYLRLLTNCVEKSCSHPDAYNLLFSSIPKSHSAYSEMNILYEDFHKKNPLTLYLLIKTGLLAEKDYLKLASYKEIIFNYLLTLPEDEKESALKQALHSGCSLNQFFSTANGLFDNPKVLLNKLILELKQIHQNRRTRQLSTTTAKLYSYELIPIYVPVHNLNEKDREKAIKSALAQNKHIRQYETPPLTHVSINTISSSVTNKSMMFSGSSSVTRSAPNDNLTTIYKSTKFF